MRRLPATAFVIVSCCALACSPAEQKAPAAAAPEPSGPGVVAGTAPPGAIVVLPKVFGSGGESP